MILRILTKTRKNLNATFILSFSLFVLLWLVIFPLMAFGPENSDIAAFLIFLSGISLSVSLIAVSINLLYRPQISLSDISKFRLTLNTTRELDNITKEGDIEYAQNFLISDVDKTRFEIDNGQAFKLHGSKLMEGFNSIKAEPRRTKYLEESPKELFNNLMSLLSSAD